MDGSTGVRRSVLESFQQTATTAGNVAWERNSRLRDQHRPRDNLQAGSVSGPQAYYALPLAIPTKSDLERESPVISLNFGAFRQRKSPSD